MTPRTVTLLWLVALIVTLGTAAFHVGCAGSQKPAATAAPELKQTDSMPLTCLRIERKGNPDTFLCGTRDMCMHAHGRLTAYWSALEAKYETTGLSDCIALDVVFTEAK